jgi:hypothetical protein
MVDNMAGLVPGGTGFPADERICGKAEFGEPGLREPEDAARRVSAVTVLANW